MDTEIIAQKVVTGEENSPLPVTCNAKKDVKLKVGVE